MGKPHKGNRLHMAGQRATEGAGGKDGSTGARLGGGPGSKVSKRKAYDGLKVLNRGSATQAYKNQGKAKLWSDKKHADKKKAALQRLWAEMPAREKQPIAGVFDQDTGHSAAAHARTPRQHPAQGLSAKASVPPVCEETGSGSGDDGSSSDCSISDEDVGEGEIVFKDLALQRAWDPASLARPGHHHAPAQPEAREGGAAAKRRSAEKTDKAAKKSRLGGPAAAGSFMPVPDWDAQENQAEPGDVQAGARTSKNGRLESVSLPAKISFGALSACARSVLCVDVVCLGRVAPASPARCARVCAGSAQASRGLAWSEPALLACRSVAVMPCGLQRAVCPAFASCGFRFRVSYRGQHAPHWQVTNSDPRHCRRWPKRRRTRNSCSLSSAKLPWRPGDFWHVHGMGSWGPVPHILLVGAAARGDAEQPGRAGCLC